MFSTQACFLRKIACFFRSGEMALHVEKKSQALCLEDVKTIATFVRDRQKPLAFSKAVSKKALILPGAVVVLIFCTSSLLTVRRWHSIWHMAT
jgi:hypothetical protein